MLDEADRGSAGVLLALLSCLGGRTVELTVRVDAAALPRERAEFHPSVGHSSRELPPPRLLPRRGLLRDIGNGRGAVSFALAAAS